MKKICLFLVVTMMNQSFCSLGGQLIPMQTEASDSQQPQASSPQAPKSDRGFRCAVGLLSAVILAQTIALPVVYYKSNASRANDPSNGTNPDSAPMPPLCAVTRLNESLSSDERFNSSQIYGQVLNIFDGEPFPWFLNPVIACNSTELVSELEQKNLAAIAANCSNMPAYTAMITITKPIEEYERWFCRSEQALKDYNQFALDEIKKQCGYIKKRSASAQYCPQQPSCNFTLASANQKKAFNLQTRVRQRNDRKNKGKILERGNRKAMGPQSAHKSKKR